MAIIGIKPTKEERGHAKKLVEEARKWHKKNNSEMYQEITNFSDEDLLHEFRCYRRVNSGFCPMGINGRDDIRYNLIIYEIEKRDLGGKTRDLIDFYIMFLDYDEHKQLCSLCKKNKGKWLFSCDGREVVFCKECLLESKESRKDLADGCLRMVPDVPQIE